LQNGKAFDVKTPQHIFRRRKMTDPTRNESIPNILIVDDDLTSRLMLQSILQKEGFVVMSAVNGREGRLLAKREQPDLVIMDIQMPEENGLTACAALKANVRTANIPVIFISSVEDVTTKIDGFNAGGVDYITKPFQVMEVVARVRLQIRLFHSYRSMVAANLEQLKHLSDSQKSILIQPEECPEAAFSVFYLPAQTAGGDFYDVIHTGAGVYDYLVADISGHHAGTALPAAALKALLRQNASMLYSPLENLNLINQHLRPVLQEEQYATLIYARLNKTRMRLTLVNAGHPSAIIIRADNQAEVISQSGDGLGLFDSISLDVKEIQVAQGDRVFLFSDGLIEQNINGSISRRIGLAKLVNLINENSSARIETTVTAIQENLFPALPLREMDDDAVFLGFEVT
jgi:sigma-B regulation protein RsbU (phosphoserine phosphatase)